MIRFHNTKHVSKEHLDMLKGLGQFTLEKFFSKSKREKLDVLVRFKKHMFKKTDQYGNCVWEDQHLRPEQFIIELDPDQKIQLLLNTLAHELVHVKQWAKGEFYQLQRESHVYKFNGKRWDTEKVDYWDTPWEIEAHGRAIGLVVLWARKNKLTHKKLVVEG